MDEDWALVQLENYLHLMERVPLPEAEQTSRRKTRRRGTDDEVFDAERVLLLISGAFYEDRKYPSEQLAKSLIWEIRHGDEVRAKMGEISNPPIVSADRLHQWVWDAARPHWESGNDDAALTAAAINVNSRLQRKVGRKDVSNGKLLQAVFSLDPPKEGQPRLRLVGEENPDLFRDVHRGAMSLGIGLYAAVRNPLSHVPREEHPISEQETVEALAAFSLLARWIERAKVVTVDD